MLSFRVVISWRWAGASSEFLASGEPAYGAAVTSGPTPMPASEQPIGVCTMRRVALLAAVLVVLPAASLNAAKNWFHCLGPNECEITQENFFGPLLKSGDAKASKRATQRVASVCVAAGFSHYQILDRSEREGKRGFQGIVSGGTQQASTTIRVKFFHEEVEDSYVCSFSATKEYIKKAKKVAAKNGYPWPVKPSE